MHLTLMQMSDEYAVESQTRYLEALRAGRFEAEMAPMEVQGTTAAREAYRYPSCHVCRNVVCAHGGVMDIMCARATAVLVFGRMRGAGTSTQCPLAKAKSRQNTAMSPIRFLRSGCFTSLRYFDLCLVAGKKGFELFSVDEHPRHTTIEKMATLKPTFKKDGVVTAASASGICDGAGHQLCRSSCCFGVVQANGPMMDFRTQCSQLV